MGTAHAAVVDKHISYATRNLTADRDATVSIFHRAIFDDDVLARHVHPPSVLVSSGFDGDAIVPCAERAVRDEHIAATLWIAAVVIWPVAVYIHVSHSYVLAQHRIHLPHRGVFHCESVE